MYTRWPTLPLIICLQFQLLGRNSRRYLLLPGGCLCRRSEYSGRKPEAMADHFVWRRSRFTWLHHRFTAGRHDAVLGIGSERARCRASGRKCEAYQRLPPIGQSQCQSDIEHFNGIDHALYSHEVLDSVKVNA